MSNVVALHQQHVIIGDDFWVDASTGNWVKDCETGRNRANLFVNHLGNRDDIHPFFIQSMRTMVERGRFTGVEVGFFQRLMELATLSGDRDAKTQGL